MLQLAHWLGSYQYLPIAKVLLALRIAAYGCRAHGLDLRAIGRSIKAPS